MDLDALRTRVRRLTSIQSTAILTDAELNQIINEVYHEVAGQYDWPWLHVEDTVSISSGDRTATLPVTVQEVKSVVSEDGTDRARLHAVSFNDIEGLFEDELEDGEPVVWALQDETTLAFHPPADQSYTFHVRGLLQPDDLSVDTDEPIFDSTFHPVLAYAAAARLLAEEGDESKRIERYTEEASGYLLRMYQRYMVSHDTSLFQMGGRRTFRSARWSVPRRFRRIA